MRTRCLPLEKKDGFTTEGTEKIRRGEADSPPSRRGRGEENSAGPALCENQFDAVLFLTPACGVHGNDV